MNSFKNTLKKIFINDESSEKLNTLKSKNDIYNFFFENGYEGSYDDFEKDVIEFNSKIEISDYELDMISGGSNKKENKILASILSIFTISSPMYNAAGATNITNNLNDVYTSRTQNDKFKKNLKTIATIFGIGSAVVIPPIIAVTTFAAYKNFTSYKNKFSKIMEYCLNNKNKLDTIADIKYVNYLNDIICGYMNDTSSMMIKDKKQNVSKEQSNKNSDFYNRLETFRKKIKNPENITIRQLGEILADENTFLPILHYFKLNSVVDFEKRFHKNSNELEEKNNLIIGLKEEIKNLNNTIESLKAQNSSTNSDYNKLQAELEESEKRISDIINQNDVLSEENKKLINDYKKQIENLKISLSQKENESKSKDDEIKGLKHQLHDLKSEISKLTDNNIEYSNNIKFLEEQLATTDILYENLLMTKFNLEQNIQHLNTEYSKEIENLKNNISDLQNQLENKKGELENKIKENKELKEEKEKLSNEQKQKIEELSNKIKNLNTHLAEKDKYIDDYIGKINELNKTIDKLNKNSDIDKKKIEGLRKNANDIINQLVNDIDINSKQSLTNSTPTNNNIFGEMDSRQFLINSTPTGKNFKINIFNRIKDLISCSKNKKNELENKLRELEKKLNEVNKKNNDLEQENKELNDKIKNFKNELNMRLQDINLCINIRDRYIGDLLNQISLIKESIIKIINSINKTKNDNLHNYKITDLIETLNELIKDNNNESEEIYKQLNNFNEIIKKQQETHSQSLKDKVKSFFESLSNIEASKSELLNNISEEDANILSIYLLTVLNTEPKNSTSYEKCCEIIKNLLSDEFDFSITQNNFENLAKSLKNNLLYYDLPEVLNYIENDDIKTPPIFTKETIYSSNTVIINDDESKSRTDIEYTTDNRKEIIKNNLILLKFIDEITKHNKGLLEKHSANTAKDNFDYYKENIGNIITSLNNAPYKTLKDEKCLVDNNVYDIVLKYIDDVIDNISLILELNASYNKSNESLLDKVFNFIKNSNDSNTKGNIENLKKLLENFKNNTTEEYNCSKTHYIFDILTELNKIIENYKLNSNIDKIEKKYKSLNKENEEDFNSIIDAMKYANDSYVTNKTRETYTDDWFGDVPSDINLTLFKPVENGGQNPVNICKASDPQCDTSDYNKANWSGFVHYDENNKTIYVGLHGTDSLRDVLTDANTRYSNKECEFLGRKWVHKGFLNRYLCFDQKMKDKLKEKINERKEEEIQKIVVTGHSLGGALATLAALDIVQDKDFENYKDKVKLITFCSPRVLSNDAYDYCKNKDLLKSAIRLWRTGDIVPAVPTGLMGYKHFGKSWNLDRDLSTGWFLGLANKGENHLMGNIMYDLNTIKGKISDNNIEDLKIIDEYTPYEKKTVEGNN